jgi:predicted dehydrogenase
VTVATPNSTHFEITKALAEAGFDVLCEKPMTMTSAEAEVIVEVAARAGRALRRQLRLPGYALVRHARAMVARDLGKIRVVVAEFAHATTPTPPAPTIRASAGATTRRSRAFPPCSAMPASMRSTWPASSPEEEVETLSPISRRR